MRQSHSTQAESTASHCRLTSPTGEDCSRMYSKVSSDLLQSYIKATRLVVEIFKMAGYFPYGPRNYSDNFLFFISKRTRSGRTINSRFVLCICQ